MSVPDPPPVDVDAVRPSIADVAKLERTRTVLEDGTQVGTFTDLTFPTAADVNDVINLATDEVLGQLPDAIDADMYAEIKRLISIRSAILIEISFFRIQPQPGGPVNVLIASYLAGLETLQKTPTRLR